MHMIGFLYLSHGRHLRENSADVLVSFLGSYPALQFFRRNARVIVVWGLADALDDLVELHDAYILQRG